jgi:phenylalanyl-tRNA synthetase beta chain
MKFSEKWLRNWINPDANTHEIAEALTTAGLEVDDISQQTAEFSKVIIAEVVNLEPHPQADKLKIVTVNAGDNQLVQVVCGANNVSKGIKVPFAQVGAKLPNNINIEKATLKSVDSFGMLCAGDELGLEEKSTGLYIFEDQAPVGTDVAEFLQLNDSIIDIDLTPNRGDCLGIMGLACELGAIYDQSSSLPYTETTVSRTPDDFEVIVEDTEACPRYTCCLIRNVNINTITPSWISERLRRSGIRTIDPIVDITNYVMLEQGQPLHGYDLAKIDNNIQVRMAKDSEKLTLLDGSTIELTSDTLVIADANKALAIAGIMGGEDSGVTTATKNILLESAFFNPEAIAGKARSYGLHTESSHRFERGVDFELPQKALERATQLIIDICGGQAGAIIDKTTAEKLPSRNQITLRVDRLNKLLGTTIESSYIQTTLQRLGCSVALAAESADTFTVIPPSWRFDITIEADLIEEIARLYGYNNIHSDTNSSRFNFSALKSANEMELTPHKLLASRGYYEVISYSFIDTKLAHICSPKTAKLELANPISKEQSIMRNSLIPGLLQTAKYNINRQQNRIRFFEIGQIFTTENNKVAGNSFAMLVAGNELPTNWNNPTKTVNFYTLKQDITILLQSNNNATISYEPATHDAMHPGQCAKIIVDGTVVGYLGKIHPSVATKADISQQLFIAEINYDAITANNIVAAKPVSKYPEVKRDLAFLIDQSIIAQDVINCINSAATKKLVNCSIFDVFSSDKLAKGVKSIAINLFFQDITRTLEDAEIKADIDSIIDNMQAKLNAKLRDS